jgi:hypothetical protein
MNDFQKPVFSLFLSSLLEKKMRRKENRHTISSTEKGTDVCRVEEGWAGTFMNLGFAGQFAQSYFCPGQFLVRE